MTRRPPIDDTQPALVFSYGTLQQTEVQQALFGTEPPSHPDKITGHRLDWITITDPEVVRLSGSDRHPILRAAAAQDEVAGTAFTLTPDQLRRADAYEVDDYARIEVMLASGLPAWVYSYAPD